MIRRVTTCMWGTAWERYGRRFAQTFAEHWPEAVELVVYASQPLPLPRGECRDLMAIPGLVDFLNRHRGSPEASGHGRPTKRWRREHVQAGYCWRYDACKWVYQAVTPWAASQDMGEGDILAWFDADVLTHSAVSVHWLDTLLDGRAVAYPGRGGGSEIGFMGFRLNTARPVVDSFAGCYLSDRVFSLDETHSAFVFDAARALHFDIPMRDLTPGRNGHVWPGSVLAVHTDHLKGRRKDALSLSVRSATSGLSGDPL